MKIIWGFEDTLQSLQESHKPPDHTGGRQKNNTALNIPNFFHVLKCALLTGMVTFPRWSTSQFWTRSASFWFPRHPVLQLPRASLHPMVTTLLLIGLPWETVSSVLATYPAGCLAHSYPGGHRWDWFTLHRHSLSAGRDMRFLPWEPNVDSVGTEKSWLEISGNTF